MSMVPPIPPKFSAAETAEAASRAAARAQDAQLEMARRAITFQMKYADFLDMPKQGFAQSVLGFFRYMNAWTRAVLLGQAMPRSRAAPAGSRTEGFDPYATFLADFHSVFLTEEQLDAYMAVKIETVTKGGTAVFS
ncbi:MAG: hypothetical protein HY543_09040 [Deltaproteobacteria bacterium]|nr:hypothetical protein [Deltaproteobacteria bacterium]